MKPDNITAVYKILTEAEFSDFQDTKLFKGTELDLKDGFFHLSISTQVDATIERFFKGISPVYVLELNTPNFLAKLVWEPASSGEIFPHYYGEAILWEDIANIDKRT